MTKVRRILTALIVLAMVISMVPVGYAAEVTEDDVYVLQRAEAVGGTTPNIQFESVYKTQYSWNGAYGGKLYPAIYSMKHPSGSIIPTYCIDIRTNAEGGFTYRRLNLEDASYFTSVAGQIRTIVSNGFYVTPLEFEQYDTAEETIRVEFTALGAAAGVPDLTLSEAISATQCALWQVAHGSVLEYDYFYIESLNKSMRSNAVAYATLCKEEILDPVYPAHMNIYLSSFPESKMIQINNRIRTVYNYLLSLNPLPATGTVVSPASFTNLNDPVLTRNEDGTYDVSVTTTVYVEMAAGDDLTLKATLGDYSATRTLSNGSQTVTLTFSGLTEAQANQDVTLSISGHQTSSGIFLFDASGDRGASQTMVGMGNSRLPVYAEVVAQKERIISLTKLTTCNVPLEGIVFDIYEAASMEDYLNGKFSIENPSTRTDLADYTLITSASGKASLNLTQFGLKDGVYLLVERNHSAIVKPIDPFYVIIPATNKEGTDFDYVIQVYPKNEVKGAVKIEKDVVTLNNDEAPVDAYADHTWIISATIPDDMAQGKSYTISDTLDNRLDYVGNMVVTVETTDGATVVTTLDPATDYDLNVTNVGSLAEGHPSDSFILSLTPAGMAAVTTAVGTNNSDYRIRVRFDTQVNANAQMGDRIPNKASVTYVNSVKLTFAVESDVPVVYTGGANLLKVDKDNHATVLPGAVFQVYRMATQEEMAADVEGLTKVHGRAGSMIPVSFFDNAQLVGPKVDSVTSDAHGRIAIYGLAPGTYYLVETQAPAGYNLMDSSLALTIDATSHLESRVIEVENTCGTVLPETGGNGIQLYVVSGMALMLLSLLLILNKKRNLT